MLMPSVLTPQEITTQGGKLPECVRTQANATPFYRTSAWQAALAQPDLRLVDLPRLSKKDLRENSPDGFLRPDFDLKTLLASGSIEEESTSGTSGASVRVIFGKAWWAEQELRALRLNPFIASILENNPSAKRAVFTTPGCSGVSCFARWLNVEQRTSGSTLFVNQSRIPFTLAEDKMRQMAEETLQWAPTFLDVDPVHGARFTLYCEQNGLRFPSLRFILTSYEHTSFVHRRIMQRVFGVPIINLYGSSETGHLLIEQKNGSMTVSTETAQLEIVDLDRARVGQLLATTLSNPYLPLIRYEIGDNAEQIDGGIQIHGRVRDALKNSAGDLVTTRQIDQAFSGMEGIAHYQLRQADDGSAQLSLLPEKSGDTLLSQSSALSRSVGQILGAPISTQVAPLIAPEDSGKFRLTLRVA
jgi:phenylacetate-CoA ligase